MDKVVTSDNVLLGSDFNGHVGSDMGGFGKVHGGFGIVQINGGGIRLLDWAVGKGLHLMNTCFLKRKSRLVTFRSGEIETMVDYILVNNKYRSSVKDVKVIPGEEIVIQHCLLLMDMVFKKKVKRKVKFRKLKLWRLRESELKEEFADGVNNKCDGNEDWYDLKSKLLDVAREVSGYTKGKPRHFETWWWNKDVDVAVCRKRELFRIWRQSRNDEDRKKYCKAKKDAKRVVYMAAKYKRCKNAVEGKGLKVNVDKTKGMQLSFGKKSSVSKVDPCGVCGERVGCNSIQCMKCQRWVHRRFSDVPRQVSLLSRRNIFVCRTCLRHNCSVVERLEFKTGEDVLEEVEKFCYLGDMISCFGGASQGVSARIGSAWEKFRELSGVLVGKQSLSLMQRGKIYQCCVRPVLLYCCETWGLTVADELRLRGVERCMIR